MCTISTNFKFTIQTHVLFFSRATANILPRFIWAIGPGLIEGKGKVAVLAPSTGIAEVAKRSSGGALPSIKPILPDCSGCKVRGLHHCVTTPTTP